MPKINYTDYHGPQGDYAVVNGEYVPCTPEIAREIAQNAHLLALGDPEYAYKMVAESEQAEREQTNAA
jgi:hypothetical protein